MDKPKIFISYSHDDEDWKDLIKDFFKASNLFEIWDDREIKAGENWFNKIEDELYNADLAILLVSVRFLNSCFINDIELSTFEKRCEDEKLKIIPIILSSCSWKEHKLVSSKQGFPKDNKPLDTFWKKNNIDFTKCPSIREEIQKIIDKIKSDYYYDTKIEKIKLERQKEYHFIIDYFNNNHISKETFLETAKSFIDRNLFFRIKEYETVEKIINHIIEDEKFACIIKELYQDNNDQVKQWLSKQNFDCMRQEDTPQFSMDEPRLVIIFKHEEDDKYEVTFRAKSLPDVPNENDSEIFDLKLEKDKLLKKIMSYVGSYNPIVDLVLPVKLMIEDINLWEADWNESLSRLSKVNIRHDERYNSNEQIKNLHKEKWDIIKNKIITNKKLCCIKCENDLRDVGDNMHESGISSRYLLEEKHIKFLLKTDMSYIMLWLSKDCNEDLEKLYMPNIQDLQQNYYRLNNSPINLMWDDPNTYYYPDERKKES